MFGKKEYIKTTAKTAVQFIQLKSSLQKLLKEKEFVEKIYLQEVLTEQLVLKLVD